MDNSEEYIITLRRDTGKRTNDETIQRQIDHIVKRGLTGSRGKTWELTHTKSTEPYRKGGLWVFIFRLHFSKVRGTRGGDAEAKQWSEISAMLEQTGLSTKWGEYPWKVVPNEAPTLDEAFPIVDDNSDNAVEDEPTPKVRKEKLSVGIRQVTAFDKVQTWEELRIPPELLTSDEALGQHECFKEIYGRNEQIRTALSAIQSGIDSHGQRRNHAVLWGHAACGKTSILLAIEKLLGPGAVLRLDATSTTRAGLEKMFFTPEDMPVVPPIVFMEEIEKANEDALKIWLGALDERGEIRKVNFRMAEVREIRVLFFCTVNNKRLFDNMMGSDGSEKGALASRCVTDIYCPRPDPIILRQILLRDIRKRGGDEAWVDHCLELSQKLGTNDPRKVLSFLAGGERLMDGGYQKDRLAIHEAEKEFEQRDKTR